MAQLCKSRILAALLILFQAGLTGCAGPIPTTATGGAGGEKRLSPVSTRFKETLLDDQPVVANEILVRFKTGVENIKSKLPAGTLIPIYPSLHIYRVILPGELDLPAALKEWGALPEVIYSEPNHIRWLELPPSSPKSPQKLAKFPQLKIRAFTAPWNLSNIKVPEAWTITKGSSDMIVAVLDTGVDPNQPSLKPRLLPLIDEIGKDIFTDSNDVGHDFTGKDGDGHGTHVSGIVAGAVDETNNIAGVGPEIKILPIKVLDSLGFGSSSSIVKGIQDAVNQNVKVINMSLGGGEDLPIKDAVADAIKKGTNIVASAGNDRSFTGFPAAYPGVIAVAATTLSNKIAWYSNFGPDIFVAAPGGDTAVDGSDGDQVVSTWPTYLVVEDYQNGNTTVKTTNGISGTSMAAPHVSGAIALLLSKETTLNREQVRIRLGNSVSALVGSTGVDRDSGFGLIDVQKLLGSTTP